MRISNSTPSRRSRYLGGAVIAAAASLTLIFTPTGAQGLAQIGDDVAVDDIDHLDDLDTRDGADPIQPTAAQLEAVAALGATARWTPFGTPQSLIKHGDFLATGIEGSDAVEAAQAWLNENRVLYRLDSVEGLVVHADVELTDSARVVVFRQLVGGLPVSPEGFASIGLVGSADEGWSVAYASSTLAADQAAAGPMNLTMRDAFVEAADDAGTDVERADIAMGSIRAGWRVLDVDDIDQDQLIRRVAFPTTDRGVRRAYETVYSDGAEESYRYVIDAATGDVLLRQAIVDHAADDPTWEIFPATPPLTPMSRPPWNYSSGDTRQLWCWTFLPGCRLAVENDAARVQWDVDAQTGVPTFTTIGNAVDAAEWWNTVPPASPGQRPTSPDREYRYPWTNVWYETRCHSGNLVPGGTDIDASVTNLFVGTWRMHDWSYHLGFTEATWNGQAFNFGINPAGEGDPVTARAQAGAITPGSRDNATMNTQPDGTPSIMSMFLWQPIANAFYGPCVVGDYDMSVIGHEYTHMIENRMIGKGFRRMGFHAGAMGESWSDFVAMEYHNEYGLLPTGGQDRWAVGPYVTGNPIRGIRNYNMSFPSAGQFPQPGRDLRVGAFHFGSMGYDIVGPQVHADGEIWSATNHDLRSLFLERYPSPGGARQRDCADGLRDAQDCPGNRQWIQTVFDAFLLMPTNPTMLDARDAYFAADMLRFGGTNQDLLWLGFARRGFGENASVEGTQDTNPVPSFESPMHEEATLRFEAVAKDEGGQPVDAQVFGGNYEARTTALQSVERFVPNPEGYNFVANAEGYGHVRFFVNNLRPGEDRTITVHLPTNVASLAQGATASGDGVRHSDLIDDTEATNWESTTAPVEDVQVTITLDGRQSFAQAKASAMLLPGQNRFTALRQFELYACLEGNAANPTCDGSTDDGWTRFLRSHRDAFPAPNPRPSSPDLLLRSFQIPPTTATHVKFVVEANQCTGNPNYQGDQHDDPASPTSDCRSITIGADQVRAAELQLLTSTPRVDGATLSD